MKLLEILSQSRLHPRTLNIVGGGANIDVWNQIRSDVSGLKIQKLAVTEATCLGTALFCMAGLDNARSLRDISDGWIKVAKRFRPNRERTQTYKNLARLFDNYIETNADIFQDLNELKR